MVVLATVPSVQFFSAHPACPEPCRRERRARKASPKSKGSVRMKPFFVHILHCIDGSSLRRERPSTPGEPRLALRSGGAGRVVGPPRGPPPPQAGHTRR